MSVRVISSNAILYVSCHCLIAVVTKKAKSHNVACWMRVPEDLQRSKQVDLSNHLATVIKVFFLILHSSLLLILRYGVPCLLSCFKYIVFSPHSSESIPHILDLC